MGKRKKGKGLGLLYAAIAICLLASGAAVYRLTGELATYEASKNAYAGLRERAVREAETKPQDVVIETGGGDGEDGPDAEEVEGEAVEDEAFLWMLNHQNSTWDQSLLKKVDAGIATAGASAPGGEPHATATPALDMTDGKGVPEDEGEREAEAAETPGAAERATPAPTPTPTPTATPLPAYIPKEGVSMERAVTVSEARYTVDFDYLGKVNREVVGWLYQDETGINYPIMRGSDNTYYLTHMMDKSTNPAGSVFMDCGNSAAFIDEGTYLYAHNQKNGGMFAPLSGYAEQSYYERHPQMLLLTPFADYQVDLFAGMLTTVDDETSWRVKEFEDADGYRQFIADLRQNSLFRCGEESVPEWGDRLLVLVTCTNLRHGERYVIFGRMRPMIYESAETVEATKLEMDERPTQNGFVDVGPLGKLMVYAQNDGLWAGMRYDTRDTGKYRKFGQGGCGPTAVAMAVANLVDKEKLPALIGYANSDVGYTFCPCSVNRYFCNHTHAQYHLKTPDEFLRYLPLAMANFATGNNIWKVKSRTGNTYGTNMRFLEHVCNIYRLRLYGTRQVSEAIEKLRQGNCMAVSCTTRGGPFTKSGHYVVLAGVDDEYVYVLDPLRRDDYSDLDRREVLELLAPGVVRIKLENITKCNLSPLYILEKTEE